MALSQYRIRPLSDLRNADLITVAEASCISCIGVNSIYRLIKNPDVDFVVHCGPNRKRTLIDRERFLSYLHRKG